MRIALGSQEFPPETDHGGIATQAWLKARGLAARGHDVVVVSCAVDGRRSERVDTAGYRVVRVPPDDAPPQDTEPERWRAWSAALAAELRRLHSAAPLDVIEFPEWGAEGWAWLGGSGAAAGWPSAQGRPDLGGAGRPPTVIHVHGPLTMFVEALGWPEPGSDLHREGLAMEGHCLHRADAVYASSRCSAECVAEAYGLDAARIPALHAGVDLATFAQAGPKDPDPTIIFVGKIAPSKGADTLIEAAIGLARRHPRLAVELVGRGEPGFVEGLVRQAREAGFPDLVRPAGFVRREDLPERLSRAWALAAPSRYEGGPGFVLLEAMACGTPVVAGDAGGMAEAFEPGVQGFAVPPVDPDALAAALETVLADPAVRDRMGAAARRHVEATADTTVCVERIEALFRSVAASGRGAPGAADPFVPAGERR